MKDTRFPGVDAAAGAAAAGAAAAGAAAAGAAAAGVVVCVGAVGAVGMLLCDTDLCLSLSALRRTRSGATFSSTHFPICAAASVTSVSSKRRAHKKSPMRKPSQPSTGGSLQLVNEGSIIT